MEKRQCGQQNISSGAVQVLRCGSAGISLAAWASCHRKWGSVGSTIYGADREPIWHNRYPRRQAMADGEERDGARYPRRQAMADGEERDDSLPRDGLGLVVPLSHEVPLA